MSATAKFSVGQLVHHRLFDYRGVVYDIDSEFRGSDEWYEQVARSRPPKDAPWYRVLPDGAAHETYVAEQNLEPDDTGKPVYNPHVAAVFDELENGRYRPRQKTH